MRCPDCNKFVSLELSDEVEVSDEDINDGEVTVSARIVRACAECGTELKEATLELSKSAQDLIDAHEGEGEEKKHAYSVEVEGSSTVESSSYGVNKRTGKPNKGGNPRYMKTFFGANVILKVICDECSEDIGTVDIEDDVQASHMDEMV